LVTGKSSDVESPSVIVNEQPLALGLEPPVAVNEADAPEPENPDVLAMPAQPL
jgi:hypothetical protein